MKTILVISLLLFMVSGFSQSLSVDGKAKLEIVAGEEKSTVIIYKIIGDDYLPFSVFFEAIDGNLEKIAMSQEDIDGFFKKEFGSFDQRYKFKSNAPFFFIIAIDGGYSVKSVFWDRDEQRSTASSIFGLNDYQLITDNYQPLVVVPAKKRPPR